MTSDLDSVYYAPMAGLEPSRMSVLEGPDQTRGAFWKNEKEITFTGEADGLMLSEKLAICPNKSSLISVGSVHSSASFIVKRI